MHRGADLLGVGDERRLGHLEHQALGRQAGTSQDLADGRDDAVVVELLDRQVDRHGQVHRGLAVVVPPRGQVGAGALQDPLAELADQTGLLGEGDEQTRAEQTAAGVVPADQGLAADDAPGLEVEHRLVVGDELLRGDGPGEVRSQLEPVEGRRVHLRLEHDRLSLAHRLGPVHRDVGVAQQDVAGVGAVVVEDDAGRCGDVELTSVDDERARDRGEQLLGEVGHVRFAVRTLEHDDELVATDAGGDVAEGQHGGDALGDRGQQQVAEGVSERVVDVLEVVDAEQDRGDGGAAAVAAEHAGQVVEHVHAVREAGQLVVGRLVADALLHRLAVGHVTGVEHEAADGGLVAQVGQRRLDRSQLALGVVEVELEQLLGAGRRRRGVQA